MKDEYLHLFSLESVVDEQGTSSVKAAILFNTGNERLERREYVEAARLFQAAAECDPGWVSPWLNLAIAHRRYGDFDAALQAAKRATELAPDSPRSMNALGGVYLYGRQFARAKQAFQASLELAPSDKVAMLNLAATERNLGNAASSADLYYKYLAFHGRSASVLHNLSLVEWERGRHHKAVIAEIRALNELADEERKHVVHLAVMLFRMGKLRFAIRFLRAEATTFPKDPEPHAILAVVYAGLLAQGGGLSEYRSAMNEFGTYVREGGSSSWIAQRIMWGLRIVLVFGGIVGALAGALRLMWKLSLKLVDLGPSETSGGLSDVPGGLLSTCVGGALVITVLGSFGVAVTAESLMVKIGSPFAWTALLMGLTMLITAAVTAAGLAPAYIMFIAWRGVVSNVGGMRVVFKSAISDIDPDYAGL